MKRNERRVMGRGGSLIGKERSQTMKNTKGKKGEGVRKKRKVKSKIYGGRKRKKKKPVEKYPSSKISEVLDP